MSPIQNLMEHLDSNKLIGLLHVAISAALKAGEAILEIYNDPASDFQVERKADNSPLTIADRKSNEVIMEFLQSTPYPVISEENKAIPYEIRSQWHTLWIVDPLDGTKEFIKRNGEFTVNIALIDNGVPVLGVIYVPVKKELYYGTLENGAFKTDNIANVSGMKFDKMDGVRLPAKQKHTAFVVVASRSHMSPETENYVAGLRVQHPQVELTSVGSSIKICLVADGTANVYPRFAPTMEWDTAAGHAIAKAAGKEMYHEDEKTPLTYNKKDLLNPWFIVK